MINDSYKRSDKIHDYDGEFDKIITFKAIKIKKQASYVFDADVVMFYYDEMDKFSELIIQKLVENKILHLKRKQSVLRQIIKDELIDFFKQRIHPNTYTHTFYYCPEHFCLTVTISGIYVVMNCVWY